MALSNAEINILKRKAAEAEELRIRLAEVENELDAIRTGGTTGKGSSGGAGSGETLKMLQLIVDRSPVILFRRSADESAQLEYVSDNLSRFGYSPEEFLNETIHFRDIVHPDDQERVRREIEHYAEADVEEYSMLYRCLTKGGEVRWVEDQTSVVRDEYGVKRHNQGVLFDITERKLAEDALRKSEEKYRRIVETAGEGFVLMDPDLIITDVNDSYCRMIGYSRKELIGKTTLDFATEDTRKFAEMNRESLLAREYRVFEAIGVRKDGRRVPLLVHGNTLRDDAGDIIGHMAFVADLTDQKKALQLAAEVQRSLFPSECVSLKGFEIAGRNQPCDEVGGDYFDFIWRGGDSPEDPFHVVVGDISGHGVDSALLMTTARAFLRMRASQPGTISEIITAMNNHLVHDVSESGRFMTLFYLAIDPLGNGIEWVRAGHDPAFFYDSTSGEFEELKGEGVALGLTDETVYEKYARKDLEGGQVIAVGTDGIWEAMNVDGEMFGKERFRDIIRRHSKGSAIAILDAVYEELEQFCQGRRTEDDITLVVVKVGDAV